MHPHPAPPTFIPTSLHLLHSVSQTGAPAPPPPRPPPATQLSVVDVRPVSASPPPTWWTFKPNLVNTFWGIWIFYTVYCIRKSIYFLNTPVTCDRWRKVCALRTTVTSRRRTSSGRSSSVDLVRAFVSKLCPTGTVLARSVLVFGLQSKICTHYWIMQHMQR